MNASDALFQYFRGGFAYQNVVFSLNVRHNCAVKFVSRNPHRVGHDDSSKGQHSDFCSSSSDVDNHRTSRVFYPESASDRRRHRFFDECDRLRSGFKCDVLDRAFFDFRNAVGDADHDFRAAENGASADFFEVKSQHRRRHVKFRDYAVFQRTDSRNRAGGFAEHHFCFTTDRHDLSRLCFDGDYGRLAQHYSPSSQVHQCVRGSKVNSYAFHIIILSCYC